MGLKRAMPFWANPFPWPTKCIDHVRCGLALDNTMRIRCRHIRLALPDFNIYIYIFIMLSIDFNSFDWRNKHIKHVHAHMHTQSTKNITFNTVDFDWKLHNLNVRVRGLGSF